MAVELPATLPACVHGTSIAFRNCGVLILGPSGSGKSNLALQLMAFGAELISDDMTWVAQSSNSITLERPPQATSPVQIEARGLGLLDAKPAPRTPLTVILDLSALSTDRLPRAHHLRIGNQEVRCLKKVDSPAFPAMVLQYLSSTASA